MPTKAPVEHLHNQPIIVGPYEEPARHWHTQRVEGFNQTYDEITDGRRRAEEPLPVGSASSLQHVLALEEDSEAPQTLIDKLRIDVGRWRASGWDGTTSATRALLEYWARPQGEGALNTLFFAQREAIETIIFLTEADNGSHWAVKHLKDLGKNFSRGLTRLALRMATGTGKTAVMACLIAWYAVNRRGEHRADPRRLARNVDQIVVICPGRTIRDRLDGLDPRKKDNLYDEWRLLPTRLRRRLNGFFVDIVNYEKLQPRKVPDWDGLEGGKGLARGTAIRLAVNGEDDRLRDETLHEMWNRILKKGRSGRSERIVVLNDEGHHCWQRRDGEAPGVWMEALHALQNHTHYRLDQVIDFTATPIFINPARTHFPEDERAKARKSPLFPWIISEFALMEAMEAGLVKIPQPPRGDNTNRESALRNLFEANNGRELDTPEAMALVRESAEVLYQDYEKTFKAWQNSKDARIGHPVLIVVVNNKANARAIYKMLGGSIEDGNPHPSEFKLLSNAPRKGVTLDECEERTILVLSKTNTPEKAEGEQIVGGALGFREVDTGPNRASEDELREVLQSVARPGGRGEDVRCVVSVGMLTEGWDCPRVTHILGYRKFGSELLCEQTMGRALRRRDYENLEDVTRRDTGKVERRYPAEYATVFGVPFVRRTEEGRHVEPSPPEPKTRIHPVPERVKKYRIEIPDFAGYTVSSPGIGIELDEEKIIETRSTNTSDGREIRWVETAGPIGRIRVLQRDTHPRPGEGLWRLAAELALMLAEREDAQGEGMPGHARRGILFAECLKVLRTWLAHEKVEVEESDLGGDSMRELVKGAILDALIVAGRRVRKIGIPTDERSLHRAAGDWRPFLTGLKEIEMLERSELNAAACHSKLETRIARALDNSPNVVAHVRNHGPDRIEIPYKYQGVWARYVPDFFVRGRPFDDGRVPHFVLEGKGLADEKDQQKAWWTEQWWIPCANEAGADLGQVWARVEVGPEDKVDLALEEACARLKQLKEG